MLSSNYNGQHNKFVKKDTRPLVHIDYKNSIELDRLSYISLDQGKLSELVDKVATNDNKFYLTPKIGKRDKLFNFICYSK
ncbi:MAG: hypothetical protein E6R13_05725 [Spirochaetes bacterium]|nr:MAG: hypothetical protein E6R13_05725 [Spirochaetota bacterium]